jgi:hypothetical protein
MCGHEVPAKAPPIFLLLRAAKYLGVPPWELAEKPMVWQHYALLMESAEAQANEFRLKNPPPR